MNKEDYEYLKSVSVKDANYDQMISISRILDSESVFREIDDVINYFEKPYKWASEINELIKEYEQDLLAKTQCKDCKYFDGAFYCDFNNNADDLEADCPNKEVK